MMDSRHAILALAVLLSASCASVPRDAGVDDIQTAVTARGGPQISWNDEAANARVAELLADELSADEAVAVAMANSPRLQVSLAELGIARADLIEASTISNPIFEVEIRYPGEPYRPYELRLAQSLMELIQLPRRRALGRAAFDAAQMRVSAEVLRFAGDVRSAYFDAVAAQQQLALDRTAAAAARTTAELAMKQHRAENITDLDLENEQALYEQAKLDLARSERRLLLAQESLRRAIGVDAATSELRLPVSFPELPDTELSQEELEQISRQNRLDVAIARREVTVAEKRVPLARLEALEELVVDFHHEREPSGERTRGPGLEFPIPIFNTGRAARTRAEAEYLRARYTLRALETEAASLVRSARIALEEARARVEYYRDVVVPRRQRIVELTKLEHNAMIIGVYQLMQAKQNDLQARRDFIEAQREYWSARTDLDRAVQGIAGDTSFEPATAMSSGGRGASARGGH